MTMVFLKQALRFAESSANTSPAQAGSDVRAPPATAAALGHRDSRQVPQLASLEVRTRLAVALAPQLLELLEGQPQNPRRRGAQ